MDINKARIDFEKRLQALKGRKISEIRYLTDDEVELLGWYGKAVVFILDDGTLFFPSSDDECNGPGAIFVQPGKKLPEDFPALLGVF